MKSWKIIGRSTITPYKYARKPVNLQCRYQNFEETGLKFSLKCQSLKDIT